MGRQGNQDMGTLIKSVQESTGYVLKKYEKTMAAVLPKSLNLDRIRGIMWEAVRSKPHDMANVFSTPQGQASFVSAVIRSAKLGLPPDGILAAIVPRKIKGVTLASFEPMWKGLAVLAYNSGQIKCLRGDYVHEKDHFVHEDGLMVRLEHRKAREKDRGSLVAAWAVVETVYGGLIPKVVYQYDVDRARQGVRHSSNEYAAENMWAPEMWRKTAYKQALATAPQSEELRDAINLDDLDSAGMSQGLIIDIEPDVGDALPPYQPQNDMSDEDLQAAMERDAAEAASQNIVDRGTNETNGVNSRQNVNQRASAPVNGRPKQGVEHPTEEGNLVTQREMDELVNSAGKSMNEDLEF